MSLTNCAAAAAETMAEKGPAKDDWSAATCVLKYILAGMIGSYLFVALLSGDWTLPEDVRQVCFFVWSLASRFFITKLARNPRLQSLGGMRHHLL